VRHYTFTGAAVGLIFIFFSMTPSLLPRGALFQGLVSGLRASGYGLGVFAVWLVPIHAHERFQHHPPRWAWLVLIPLGVVGMVLDGDLVPRLAGPGARPDGGRTPQVV